MVYRIKLLLVCAMASTIVAGYAQAATLPTDGLVLGLAADQNISTSGGVVTAWGDLGTGNPDRVGSTFGAPALSSMTTSNGSHAAVSFDGSSGITLNDGPDLQLQTVSVFVVGNITDNQVSRIFVAAIQSNGWALGISDLGDVNNPNNHETNATKWYNGHGSQSFPALDDTTRQVMTPGVGYLISSSTSAAGETANLYDGTTLLSASFAGNTSINYGSTPLGTLGYLVGGSQRLIGNIAEVLVYNNSDPNFNSAAVTAYLDAKYFATPEPASVVSLALGGLALAGVGFAKRRKQAAK